MSEPASPPSAGESSIAAPAFGAEPQGPPILRTTSEEPIERAGTFVPPQVPIAIERDERGTGAEIAPEPEPGSAVIEEAPEPPEPAAPPLAPDARSEPGVGGLPEVSVLLNEAQALFERGERDQASDTLVRA